MSALIGLDRVSYSYGSSVVVDEVSIELAEREALSLLGPSGCGKTTLLRLILGFLAPKLGSISLRGREVSRAGRVLLPPEERNLAVVFQDLALWPHMTVEGNLEFGLRSKGIERTERKQRIESMLARVELAGKASRYPGDLSGGERQRVAIARALVLEPQAVLLDEPFSSLDLILKNDLLDLFAELFSDVGTSVLLVTHDPREAERIGGRQAVMDGGRIVHRGSLSEIDLEAATPFTRRLARWAR